MADIEKVIENVETAFDIWIDEYEGTSYYNIDEVKQAKHDALELLKEQVKTKVVFQECDGDCETVCGNCGYGLDKAYSRCPKCNRELDWNSNQKTAGMNKIPLKW